ARREVVAFQIAFRSAVDIPNLNASMSDLSGPSSIPANCVAIFREHYVPTNHGPRPDPLAPLAAFAVKANVTQPLFLEVDIPADAAAGDYSDQITLSGGDKTLATIP